MNRVVIAYALGVLALALCGLLSPWPFLGFLPVGAGLIWAAYDLIDVEVTDDDPASEPPIRG